MKKSKVLFIAQGAVIGAIYAAATYLSSVFGIAYGPIQFRLSEALTVLSAITPAAIPGLTIGCIIGNLGSPMGLWDIIFGSLASLIAASLGYKLKSIKIKNIPLPSILMPVILNGIIVGGETVFFMSSEEATFALFVVNALEVAAGELIVCLAGGIPVYLALKKSKIFDSLQKC